MVTVAERHDVAILPPWYTPAPRKVAIHRYLDAEFIAQFQAETASAPRRNAALFAWEQEDRMPANQGGVLKLRRPVHRTFHVVAWEAACKLPTLPAIQPEKIASAGFVVRSGTASAPLGFQLIRSKPQGWAAVEPGTDPDAARQVKALGLVPRTAAAAPGYTGEETFPLHPLMVQDGGNYHTLLYGYLPIGGGDFVPPAKPPAPAATDDFLMDLPWPFGLAGLSSGPPSQYTSDQQIISGQIQPPMAALLRVLLGRYQLADAAAWNDPQNGALVGILDGLEFYTDPPTQYSGQALRDWAAQNLAQGVSLGVVLRGYAATIAQAPLTSADQLLANLLKADPARDTVPLPASAMLPSNGSSLLVIEYDAQRLRAALRLRAAQLAATSAAAMPVPKLASGPAGRYFLVPFVRTICPNGCERIFWGAPSEPFAVAAAFDPDASRPSLIEMPSLADARKGAARGAIFDMPPDLADLVNGLSNNADKAFSGGAPSRGLGIRFLCSFSLPVITICAMILLSMIISLLNIFLGWMAWVKICLPVPAKK